MKRIVLCTVIALMMALTYYSTARPTATIAIQQLIAPMLAGVGAVDVNDYPTNAARLARCRTLVCEQQRVEAFLRGTPFARRLDIDDPDSMIQTALTANQVTTIKNYIIACRSDISTLQSALTMAEY